SPVASWEKITFGTTRPGGLRISIENLYVSVVMGDVLHLKCEDNHTPGAVKWFLGEGGQRKLIYVDTKTDERITRNSPGSNTDFTISIRNVTLEDAGTYYCMKEKKGIQGDKEWLKGHGTLVTVEGECEQTVVLLYISVRRNECSQEKRE
uniref:Ig-like domain-containing protein n=1 Tax=Naja naja TaxID=35670 RepID=A0A8C6XRP1_NAJNA